MSVENLERVMARLRHKRPLVVTVSLGDLRRAIMIEIGTDPRTYYVNKGALVKLGWIKGVSAQVVELTGVDLTGDY